ncbi:hypothetical protein [Streptomyces anulatus]|uniref:oxidoreductase n=1 Tax=Streptomyces anulatus TaxID=1892 RepID=UPI0033E79C55
MTPARIDATVTRFAVTAHRAEEAGFDGVEVHAAHDWASTWSSCPAGATRARR